ncbi:MAG: hypothetical protein M3Y32_07515 [Pseudomonadota bacterium]|nr:hypothetical protein [Pseudomonadota bacterium]
MNDSTGQHGPQAPQNSQALGLTALQRRRLLLRGVGKGGAVLAAAVPLASFANAPILKTDPEKGQAHLCSVSGMGSVLVSSSVVTGICKGQTAAYWHNAPSWPAFTARGQNVTSDTKWYMVFGGGNSGNAALTFKELLAPDFTGPKQIWVRAMLNAAAGYPASFPYDPAQVLAMYNDAPNRATAQSFFKNWV